MTLWTRAQQLPPECLQKVRMIYVDHFPIEVRHCLASWIESRIWTAEPEDQQRSFVNELVQEIQTNADLMLSPDMFVTKMKLLEAAKNFHMQYSHAPQELYAYMRRCLALEMEVIQNAMGTPYVAQPHTERKYSELITGLQTVRQKVNIAGEEIRSLQANIESLSLQYHECLKNKGHMNYLQQQTVTTERRDLVACLRGQIEDTERKLNALVAQITQSQMELVDHMKENITNLRQLQSQVLDDELIKWKREQQLSGNGVPMQSNLNTIQEWCELLADLIWTTRQQVNNVARINSKTIVELRQPHLAEMLDDMSKQVTGLLSTLVTSTFVIEKQPPQVMKTNTRFTATVRLLVGGQLNVYMTPPRVSVVIISEQQAQLLLKSDTQAGKGKQPVECGDILNNTGTMEYQPTSRQLSVSFRNMQLRKIKRAEKKGTESVMDEKLTLLFQSQFNVGGGELVFQVWTLSLPVVVIVHGNQEPHGWATVTWDNAFSPPGRVPFAVPDKVTWGQLAETLSLKFISATGGSLSEDNLRFLAEKIFRTSLPLNTMELNAMAVSWTQFCKDALPERNFTFWEWFYMVVKVTRDYLRTLWCDRLIMGFIQKKQAEDMLSKCPPGTFLLRFSDSELGGITIAWTGDGNEVFSLQPFTSRDLMLRSLADRVFDLTQLQFLYPNVPKDDVFSKYYTKPENEMLKNGYVKPVLVTTLPPYMSSSPAYAHSPDSHRNTPSVNSSYFGESTPIQVDSLMNSDLFEQIRAYEPDNQSDEFDIYSDMCLK
ncbi:signal transducer and activator of transcription 5A isoform X1 [Bombyx mandarina]|uniref:Signal transducer and activator of transcription n=1 Tax=Bombyx mandarina TaxID=7092 RepID=A0A6J2JQK5_BOMMA|nr:signal transducer and activator of transcription 5A isoform X1 [Bombyx mandarina]XP_028032016.1 signal transducer and activator of transcription 5A isoform X1 [Bombyx mandarina]XP_028032017.1 signal transducer and activator of transcription 5A isoform X1 [Bombyx mandarina]XP_028032018.1 signal transducer and activator of transcription 5A isoform X1 [Bombyx mandarina]